jgi:signal transduction histidine kinase
LQLDAYKMDRVFSNLINNAIKFSHQQSTIKIELSQAESIATVAVQDNGIGISQEHQEQIFDKFGSIRQDGTAGEKSFGLGLSICKQIVDAHNGKIWVESEVDKGSCFYVQLGIA